MHPHADGDDVDPVVARAKQVRGRSAETSDQVDRLVRAVDDLTEQIAQHRAQSGRGTGDRADERPR